jgi:hypothetical protein
MSRSPRGDFPKKLIALNNQKIFEDSHLTSNSLLGKAWISLQNSSMSDRRCIVVFDVRLQQYDGSKPLTHGKSLGIYWRLKKSLSGIHLNLRNKGTAKKITPQRLRLIDQIRRGLRAETLCRTRADTTNIDVDMARSDHVGWLDSLSSSTSRTALAVLKA